MKAILLALVVGVLIAQPTPASAQRRSERSAIDGPRRSLAALDYAVALQDAQLAIRSGSLSRRELAEAYMISGSAAAARGEVSLATDYFASCIYIDSSTVLEDGTSPKLSQPFAAARERLRSMQPLSMRLEVTTKPDGALVRAHVIDPMKMAAGIRVDAAAAAPTQDAYEVVTHPAVTHADVDLRDAFGNVLMVVGIELPKIQVLAPARELRPRYVQRFHPALRWYIWGTASLLSFGVGVYAISQTRETQRSLDGISRTPWDFDYSDFAAADDRYRQSRTATALSLSLGAGLAVASVASFIWRFKRIDVDVAIQPGATSVSWTSRF